MRYGDLLAAKKKADAALAAHEAELVAELVAAKDAARREPNERNRGRKARAVAAVQEARAHARQGRTGHAVGGDAFLSPVQNGG